MSIRGLVFDFDGLILDTETPEFQVLQEIFAAHNCYLPLEKWALALGSTLEAFNPIDYLIELSERPLDRKSLHQEWKTRSLELIEQQPPLPGILQTLEQAKSQGLKLGVASSSPSEWVNSHLTRLGLIDFFDAVLTASDVLHVKPHPELYLRASQELGAAPAELIALEDSPNGITAARAAGYFCLAVPNSLTRLLDTSHASFRVDSLAELSLENLLQIAN